MLLPLFRQFYGKEIKFQKKWVPFVVKSEIKFIMKKLKHKVSSRFINKGKYGTEKTPYLDTFHAVKGLSPRK